MKLNLFERFRQHRQRVRVEKELHKRVCDFTTTTDTPKDHSNRKEDPLASRKQTNNNHVKHGKSPHRKEKKPAYSTAMIYRLEEEEENDPLQRSHHSTTTTASNRSQSVVTAPSSPRRSQKDSLSSNSRNRRSDGMDRSAHSCHPRVGMMSPQGHHKRSVSSSMQPTSSRSMHTRDLSMDTSERTRRSRTRTVDSMIYPQLEQPAEQQQQQQNPPPASAAAIKALAKRRVYPRIEKHLLIGKTCGVCLESLMEGDLNLTKMPCGHIMHNNCLCPWLHRTCTCPECRYEIATNDMDYEKSRVRRMKHRPTVPCTCGGPKCDKAECFFTCEPVNKKDIRVHLSPSKKVKRKRITREELKAMKSSFLPLGGNLVIVDTAPTSPADDGDDDPFYDEFSTMFKDDETLAVQSICI